MDRRLARFGCATIVTAAVAVTGCGSTSAPATAAAGAASPTAVVDTLQDDPSGVLADAAGRLLEQSFAVEMTMGTLGRMEGVIDPVGDVSAFRTTMTQEGFAYDSETRVIGSEVFSLVEVTSSDYSGGTGGWTRMELGEGAPTSAGKYDVAGVAESIRQATDVRQEADGTFAGMLDLRASAGALGLPAEMLGASSTMLPFQAAVDGEGRLVRFRFRVPAVAGQPETVMDAIYSDFGTPVDVQAPPVDEANDFGDGWGS